MNYLDITVNVTYQNENKELGYVTIFDNHQIKEHINGYRWINELSMLAMDLHLKEMEANKIIEANDRKAAEKFIKVNRFNKYVQKLNNKLTIVFDERK